ncbi:MAG: hypothetical protein HQ556_11670 [Candidatus Marinimicrobia bacterium]|nr:hypothetical protein [Candidatus Neomarinimicrobiota bacterium]
MVLVRYQCCICGENIDKDSQFDPCGVSIFSNLDKDENDQLEAMFFCHYDCFRGSMDLGVRMHLNLEDQE